MSDLQRRPWKIRIGLAVLVWLGVCVGGWLLGNDPQPGLIALIIAVSAGTLWLFQDASDQAEPTRWDLPDTDPARVPGEDARLALLQRVISAHLVSRTVTDQLQRHLATVADERLMAHHGISRLADPGRADTVMGPELFGFLDAARPPRLDLARINQLLNRIETL